MNFFKKLFYSLTFIFLFVAPQNSFGMEEFPSISNSASTIDDSESNSTPSAPRAETSDTTFSDTTFSDTAFSDSEQDSFFPDFSSSTKEKKKEKTSLSNPGKFILLNGTSSAGKSKLAQSLQKTLQQKGIETKILSLDDFTQEDIDEIKSEETSEETSDEEDSRQYFAKESVRKKLNFDNKKKINKSKSPLEKEHRLLRTEIIKSLHKGENIICDLVSINLANEDQTQYFLDKLAPFKPYTILLYSSPEQLVENVNQRNQAQSPVKQRNQAQSPAEKEERSLYFVLQQYPAMFKKTTTKENSLDTITKESIKKACLSCFPTLHSAFSTSSSKTKKTSPLKSVNKYAYDRLVQYFLKTFQFEDQETAVYIEPRWNHYDYIFKNTLDVKMYNSNLNELISKIEIWFNSEDLK